MGAPSRFPLVVALGLGSLLTGTSCKKERREAEPLTIGLAYETLESEFWVASLEGLKEELARRGFRALEAIADGDANRQHEQIQTFIARRVDGIIVVPKDAHTILPSIKAANRAGIPIVLNNRPPARQKGVSSTVSVDNRRLTRAAVEHMCGVAKAGGGATRKAALLIGDLGDVNAVERREGFDEAIAGEACRGAVDVVARIPTEWNQQKALAGFTNALQAHPDIDFVFCSADFLLPSVASALKGVGRYHPVGAREHVILGAFDGASNAYRMLREGHLDVDAVQDAFAQGRMLVSALLDLRAGKPVPPILRDPGVVVHPGNLEAETPRFWGARFHAQGTTAAE